MPNPKEFAGAANTHMTLIGVGRHTDRPLESAQCVELVQACIFGEGIKRQIIRAAVVNKVAHAAYRTMDHRIPNRAALLDMAGKNYIKQLGKDGLPFERSRLGANHH